MRFILSALMLVLSFQLATQADARSNRFGGPDEFEVRVKQCAIRNTADIRCELQIANISDRDFELGIIPSSALGRKKSRAYLEDGRTCDWHGHDMTVAGRVGTKGQRNFEVLAGIPAPMIITLKNCSGTATALADMRLVFWTGAGFYTKRTGNIMISPE